MDTKKADLETKREAAGNYGKVFDAIIDAFSQCNVEWATPTATLIADLERDTDDQGSDTIFSECIEHCKTLIFRSNQ